MYVFCYSSLMIITLCNGLAHGDFKTKLCCPWHKKLVQHWLKRYTSKEVAVLAFKHSDTTLHVCLSRASNKTPSIIILSFETRWTSLQLCLVDFTKSLQTVCVNINNQSTQLMWYTIMFESTNCLFESDHMVNE